MKIIEVEAPIHASNVMIIDPKTGKRTRIAHEIDEKGTMLNYVNDKIITKKNT